MIEGIINLITLLTPESCHPHMGFGNCLMCWRNGNKKTSCNNPATKTAIAKTMPGLLAFGANQPEAIIRTTFRITGVNAVAQNCLLVFKIAPANAAREINRRYGNVKRSMATAKSYRFTASMA